MTGACRGDLLDLPPLGEHVSRLHRLGKLVPDAGDDDVHCAGVMPDGLKLAVKLVQRHHRHAPGLVDVKFQLLLAGQGVNHVGNAPHKVHRIKHEDGLGAVGHGDRHRVPGPDADGLEAPGAGLGLLHQPPVAGGLSHEIKGGVIGILFRDLLYLVEHGALEIFQMGRAVPQALQPGPLCRNLVHISNLPPPPPAFPAAPGFPAAS